MRVVYQEKQERWQAFRDAEKQRRLDKAREQEMNRLNSIIAESRARREYTHSKFHHTLTVRSYHHAALTIQRAYRRVRLIRAAEAKLASVQLLRRNQARERAARVIQRRWRVHQQDTLYRAMHFVSIMTDPVVAVGQRVQSPPGECRSYEKGTSTTGLLIVCDCTDLIISFLGSPKRKRHETLPGGFKVFRPLTRDLLRGSSLPPNTSSRDSFSRPDLLNTRRQRAHVLRLGSGSGHAGGTRQAGNKVITLPTLFKQLPAMKPAHLSTTSTVINLPDIVSPRY